MKLRGKAVLVTGASMGIGLEIARALCRAGARVALAARSRERLDEAVAALRAEQGEAWAIEMDVCSTESVQAGVGAAVAVLGRLDVVVNNAGSGGGVGWWAERAAEETRALFDVHVLGTERVIRAALPVLRAQGGGTIVNFASTVGWVPMPGAAAYSAAKAAVISLSASLRTELAPDGVDVRVFAPPHTSTESGKAMPLDLPKIFEPAWVAERFLSFLRRDRVRALPGGNWMLLLIQRIAPSLAARIMDRIGLDAIGRTVAAPRALSS